MMTGWACLLQSTSSGITKCGIGRTLETLVQPPPRSSFYKIPKAALWGPGPWAVFSFSLYILPASSVHITSPCVVCSKPFLSPAF